MNISLKVPASISNFETVKYNNKHVNKGTLKVFSVGSTADKREFSKEFSDFLLKSLPLTPVVAFYDEEKQDFVGHNDVQYIYGFVPEDAVIEYVTGEDGVEWAQTDVFIFDERQDNIGFVAEKILGKQHSLEMNPETVKYNFITDENGNLQSIVFTEGEFVGLSVLGDDEAPAFTGSEFFTCKGETLENIKFTKASLEQDQIETKQEESNNATENVANTGLIEITVVETEIKETRTQVLEITPDEDEPVNTDTEVFVEDEEKDDNDDIDDNQETNEDEDDEEKNPDAFYCFDISNVDSVYENTPEGDSIRNLSKKHKFFVHLSTDEETNEVFHKGLYVVRDTNIMYFVNKETYEKTEEKQEIKSEQSTLSAKEREELDRYRLQEKIKLLNSFEAYLSPTQYKEFEEKINDYDIPSFEIELKLQTVDAIMSQASERQTVSLHEIVNSCETTNSSFSYAEQLVNKYKK